ncbi:MAG: phosphoethanolamine--lipid A transferase [Hyphomicrobium sp.]|nr:phosphoethanolamine--lipid A transferase [Hyphomicrobium sp.]
MRALKTETIVVAASVWMALALNSPFWLRFYRAVEPNGISDWLFLAVAVVGVVACNAMILMIIAHRPVFRVVMAVVLPVTAAASYFMGQYGIIIDGSMIRNAIETDTREAGDLISASLIVYVLVLGVLPAVALWFVPWQPRPLRDRIVAAFKTSAVVLPLLGILAYPFFGNFLSVLREHKEVRMALTPANVISGLLHYANQQRRTIAAPLQSYGDDAVRRPSAGGNLRPRLFVIVVGESARAEQFSLNGYARPTTPRLAEISGLVNYPNASSCSTDTAHSVPCMFSGLGWANFSVPAAALRENLLDVLRRAGFDVIWRDNQSGCKGVCARIVTQNLSTQARDTSAMTDETHDDVLLDGLREQIATLSRDTVLVLHMMGSHGPAYWKRVPATFAVFQPVCREIEFSRCTPQELINAYDNTIHYTDHVLAQLIDTLDGASTLNVDAAMIYLSDHGESLGERNLYLHGMPFAIAPSQQTHIPMLTWLSPGFEERVMLDHACLQKSADASISHDHLFHSVLGVLDVATRVYDPALDIYHACRTTAVSGGGQSVPVRPASHVR